MGVLVDTKASILLAMLHNPNKVDAFHPCRGPHVHKICSQLHVLWSWYCFLQVTP